MFFRPGSKKGLYSSFRRKPESICALGSGLRRNDGQNTLPIYQIGITYAIVSGEGEAIWPMLILEFRALKFFDHLMHAFAPPASQG